MADFDTTAAQFDAARRAEELLLGVSSLYGLGEAFIAFDSLITTNAAGESLLIDALFLSTEWTTVAGMMFDLEAWRIGYARVYVPVLDLSTVVVPSYALSGQRLGVMQRAQNLIARLQAASQLITRLVDLSALYTAGTDTTFNAMVDAIYIDEWPFLASFIVDLDAVNSGWTGGTGAAGAASIDVLALTL